jgi:hypothetical protein
LNFLDLVVREWNVHHHRWYSFLPLPPRVEELYMSVQNEIMSAIYYYCLLFN